MRVVMWTDQSGYNHRALLRDTDPDSLAPAGVPLDPPNLDALDWEGAKRDLHNELVRRGLASWQDIQRAGGAVGEAVISVFRRRVVALYRMEEQEAKHEQPG